MCRRIGSASFLAAAFRNANRCKISYDELAIIRRRIAEFRTEDGQTFSVRWTRESLSSVFGGSMDVFRAQSDCVWCDLKRLPSIQAMSMADDESLNQLTGCFGE